MAITRVALAAVLVLLAWVSATPVAGMQSPPRVGWLGGDAESGQFLDVFRQQLHDLGYVEGQNVIVEARSPGPSPERYPDLAAELVRSKVSVIVAASPPVGALAAGAKLFVDEQHCGDVPVIAELLTASPSLVLAEPFQRIRDAVVEARKMGPMLRAA